jgi:hypothetical protein
MTALGFRCSNQDYTYAVLAGSREQPDLVATESIPFPQGFSRQQCLRWFFHETEALLDRFSVDIVVMKEFEGQRRDKSFVARVEHEAMIYLASANCGITGVFKKRKCTIAKDLGLKGQARYLSRFDTSAIPDFDSLPAKAQEAVLSAWSEL